jgi:uncharacterized cupin superfamily protein
MLSSVVSSKVPAPSLIETARVTSDLLPSPINPSWIIEGNPQAKARQLCQSLDRLVWTVVWECSEGRFDWYYSYDETVFILEGSIVVEGDGLPPTRYGVGDVILFRKGAHARWHVEEHVKKLAVCHRVLPSSFSFLVRLFGVLKRSLAGGNSSESLREQLQ